MKELTLHKDMNKFIDSMKKDFEFVHSGWNTKCIIALEKAVKERVFPELENGREYNIKWRLNGVEVISHIPFWDEKLNCWNFKDTQTVAIIDFDR